MKQVMKKIGLLFAVFIMFALFLVSANALDATGQCGDNVYWNYNTNTGKLVLSGDGATWGYDYEDDVYSPFSDAYISSITINEGITVIGEELFLDTSVMDVFFPQSLSKIEDRAFAYCKELTSLKLNNTLQSIGEEAFNSCENISGALIIPDSVTHIGRYAFQFCSKFERLYIGKRVGSLGPYTFNACSGIQDIIINPALKRIDVGSFAGVSPKHTYFTSYDAVTNCMDPRYRGENLHYDYVFDGEHFCSYTEKNIKQSTCTEKGYTTNICNCGYSYTSDYIEMLDHIYSSKITIQPTHLTVGIKTFTCECGDSYTEEIAKLEGHTYTLEVRIEPTHTTIGVETFTCECGATYTEELAKIEGHTYTSEVTTEPSHLTTGVKTFRCECGDTYTEEIAKIIGHTYNQTVISPTCTEQGFTTNICSCGDSYNDDFVPAKGHSYENMICKYCSKSCSCNCHKGGFMGFIWKIINFFQKLFKTNPVCACGVKHW